MKRYLLSVAILVSSSAYAGHDYDSCTDNSNTELCQAYLAGLNYGKEAADTTAMVEQEDPFRSRALEQRVGERYRKTVLVEKKSAEMAN